MASRVFGPVKLPEFEFPLGNQWIDFEHVQETGVSADHAGFLYMFPSINPGVITYTTWTGTRHCKELTTQS